MLASHRGRYLIQVEDAEITASRARELRDFDIVPGDKVDLTKPDTPDALARIEKVQERFNAIKRTSDDSKSAAKTIAANVDQVGIIVSTTTPAVQPEFIKRVLAESIAQKATPLLIITKSDLVALDLTQLPREALNVERFDRQTQYSSILDALQGCNTVLIGLSGVGKSTLVNQIFPEALRKTADVSENGDGKHTSTSGDP